jgi:hypothetical protein
VLDRPPRRAWSRHAMNWRGSGASRPVQRTRRFWSIVILFVWMIMGRSDEVRRKLKPDHRHILAVDHLAASPVREMFDRDGLPVPMPAGFRVQGLHRLTHYRFSLPASIPEPPAAYSGCTLTTPNCLSSRSRFAAIIHRKLIDPPGAATLGW